MLFSYKCVIINIDRELNGIFGKGVIMGDTNLSIIQAILDERKIVYNIFKGEGKQNYHGDEPETVIHIEDGYMGFYSEFGFDYKDRLIYVKAFEG